MRKALLVLGLTASLLASGANRPSPLDPLWAFLSSIWAGQPTADAGCGMDPNGRCQPAPQPTPDEGCGMDPNGCPGS
jgi:hypothetical protein